MASNHTFYPFIAETFGGLGGLCSHAFTLIGRAASAAAPRNPDAGRFAVARARDEISVAIQRAVGDFVLASAKRSFRRYPGAAYGGGDAGGHRRGGAAVPAAAAADGLDGDGVDDRDGDRDGDRYGDDDDSDRDGGH